MFRRLTLLALCLGTAVPTLSIREAAARERIPTSAFDVGATKAPTKPEQTLTGTLNVNDASADQWQLLPGIGPSTAAKVLDYRASHPFKTIEQVMRVKGIGRKTFNRIKPYLSTEGATTLAKPKAKPKTKTKTES